MRKFVVRVTLTTGDDADRPDVAQYVQDALESHCGSLHPPTTEDDGDPMWGVEDVDVLSVIRSRKKV